MKTLYVVLLFCVGAFGILDSRENDINYKRYLEYATKSGKKSIDLLGGEVTARATENDVTYYIYTKNLDHPHVVAPNQRSNFVLPSSHFDPSKRSFVVIHGWVDDHTADVNTLVRASILSQYDVNIIIVDWSSIAKENYLTAQSSVKAIGEIVGNFINNLIQRYDLNGDQITLIGHSLGAHVSGNAGKVIQKKVGQIIGLDPAAPGFSVDRTDNRLHTSDAQYVQIIHTSGLLLGFSSSIGHVDFYPNGGVRQTGCGLDIGGTCAHARAFQYLAEAIQGAKFTGTKCGTYSDFQRGRCDGNEKATLGLIDVDQSVVGDYFLDTNGQSPFARG